MKFGVGTLFVVIGLLILWLAVTGRLSNVESAWRTLTGQAAADADPKPVNAPGRTGRQQDQLSVLSSILNVPDGFPTLPVIVS